MIPPKSTNGKFSTSKIVWIMISVLVAVVIFLSGTIRMFISMGAVQYATAIQEVEDQANDNSKINARQDNAIENIKEDIFEIKDMTQDIYFFVSGIDPTKPKR